MLNSPYTLILILNCLLLNGCGDGAPSRKALTVSEIDAGAELRSVDPIKLTADSDYYTSLPPQGRPPDGTLPAGTVVTRKITRTSELPGRFYIGPDGVQGFFLVQTNGGGQVYLEIEGIESAEDVEQSHLIKQQPTNATE